MLKKIIKKDNNEELEKILEKKDIDEQAKNLLQGILYKIEVSYNDYQKAKGIEQTQEQYVEQLLTNIKKKCNKIRVVRISQKFDEEQIQKQLKNKKYYVGEQEIISYSIEQKILYEIEKQANNKKILNNKYGEITIAVSDFINMGKDIDRVEVLRDFNGWSWTTIKKEIENIDANLIYQLLQILFGKEFLDNWCRDKDGIIDYFEVLTEEGGSKYGNEKVESIKDLLIKIAIFNDVKENEELHAYIDSYYRKKMTEAIYRQQLMTMNGKNGAVCAFIYHLIPLFGRQVKKGIFIDLQITNDDIANFCGVSTRNSVNRILRGLREENVITMVYHKILILDVDYLKRYVQ